MLSTYVCQKVELFLISCVFLQPSDCLTLLMMKDLTVDNQPYFHKSMTTFVDSRIECTRRCGLKNGNTANFGRWVLKTSQCECFQASEDFTDSRNIAPKIEDSFFFVSG